MKFDKGINYYTMLKDYKGTSVQYEIFIKRNKLETARMLALYLQLNKSE